MVARKKFKKAGLAFSIQMMCNLLLLITLFSGGLYLGSQTLENYRKELLIEQAKAIDHALDLYAKAHVGVDATSISFNQVKEKLNYNKIRRYPENLNELGVIRDEFGYLSKHLKFQSLDTVNYDMFQYSIQTSNDGKMTYRLEVLLPNGYSYTSPGSLK